MEQSQKLSNFHIRNMPRNPVRTEQKSCIRFKHNRFHINFNRTFCPQGATNDIFTGMIFRLFGCHSPGADFFFNHRMILCFPKKIAPRIKPIETRISNVPDSCNVTCHLQ